MRAALIGGLLLAALSAPAGAAPIEVRPYGTTSDGQQVHEYVLRNARGAEVRFISYGATVTAIEVPDRQGNRENVVLGFGNLADYEAKNRNYYFGSTVGRFAGRIGGARFTLDGRDYALEANDGANTLHGGTGPGFDTRVWRVEPLHDAEEPGAVLHYTSPAGEQGFPGTVQVAVTYRLMSDNSLRIDCEATTDAPTHINLTNHSYFNLAGAGSGSVLDQSLELASDRLVEVTNAGISTGQILPVEGTAFDFLLPKPLRQCMSIPVPEGTPNGCNHSWMVPQGSEPQIAARLTDQASGRLMDVLMTEPSIHVYTANYVSGEDSGAQGTPYRAYDGVALETQHLPDSPNRPEFPTTLLRPGETFRSTTIYRFRTF